MKNFRRGHGFARSVFALVLVVACGTAHSAAPADYPLRPIRIIVAGSPGSADEFFARSLAEPLEKAYGERLVIAPRPGAGGLIGNQLVSRAGSDGYTVGMVGVTRLITALMREQPPYRALADISAVAHVASITNVLVVAPDIPLRTAAEFVRYARVRPGELNYASLGIGSASHLASAVFDVRCAACHWTASFRLLSYRHRGLEDLFGVGSHAKLPCRSCHKTETGQFPAGRGTAIRFKPGRTCLECHP